MACPAVPTVPKSEPLDADALQALVNKRWDELCEQGHPQSWLEERVRGHEHDVVAVWPSVGASPRRQYSINSIIPSGTHNNNALTEKNTMIGRVVPETYYPDTRNTVAGRQETNNEGQHGA